MNPYRRRGVMAIGITLSLTCHAGPAVNQFELKDLEVEVGRWEFQSQNAHAWNQPDRAFFEDEPGVFEYDDNAVSRRRHALEVEYGVSEWFRTRLGVEFEKERLEEPPGPAARNRFESLELEELAIEGVAVIVPVDESGFGFGMLFEYQHVLASAEANSLVAGPIIEARWFAWSLVLNPALVQFFGAADNDDKLDFAYALQAIYRYSPSWQWGIEAYGTLERVGSSGDPGEEARLFGDHDLHRAGPIVYYRRRFGTDSNAQALTIGAGLFWGLNEHTPDQTLKWSVEFEF
jgi:hypothetical protein